MKESAHSQAHKYFEIVIFTAGVQDYADPLIDLIDPNRLISRRHYRDVVMLIQNSHI